MSGVVKGVGKVFRRVTKGGGLLPAVLATGAVLFTAGSALGVTDSWGKTISSAVGSVAGEGSTLANVLSGAITKAGYGALAGAAAGALGGDVAGGMSLGAIGGAALGGYEGYSTSAPTQAAAGENGPAKVAGTPPGLNSTQTVPTSNVAPPVNAAQGGANSLLNANAPSTTPSSADVTSPKSGLLSQASAAGGAGAKGASGSWTDTLFAKDGWLERNGQLAGGVIAGVGKGLLSGTTGTAKDLRLQQQLVQQNYAGTTTPGAHTGLLNAGAGLQVAQARPAGQTPGARFNQMIYGQTVWDPATGRLVTVPAAQA